MHPANRLLPGLVLLLCAACMAPFDTYKQARSQAPGDLRCQEIQQDQTVNEGPLEHAFQGCGRHVIYRCSQSTALAQCQLVAEGEGQAWNSGR